MAGSLADRPPGPAPRFINHCDPSLATRPYRRRFAIRAGREPGREHGTEAEDGIRAAIAPARRKFIGPSLIPPVSPSPLGTAGILEHAAVAASDKESTP